jgi:alanine racemase
MIYAIQEIANAMGGQLFLSNTSQQEIKFLLTDSRQLAIAAESLFFALKGERHDGHRYVTELAKEGVCNMVVSDPAVLKSLQHVNFILVEDTLQALQQLALHHRQKFSLPVVGITGSNGKTIIKEWLYQLLRENYHIVRSPKSYNSQIGVPLSVWQLNSEHTLALFEAGISHAGEMQQLEKIVLPTIGIFSNIGQAHDENFSSLEQKIKEKLLLFRHAKTLIYCRDYSGIHEVVLHSGMLQQGLTLFSWSRRMKADLQIARIDKKTGETFIQGIYKNDFISITIPFTDDASIENAIHCWALLLFLGFENERIALRMELLNPVAMRLEMKDGINNCSVINDSYNSDLGSLQIALDFLSRFQQHKSGSGQDSPLRKTLILSDILQSGKDEESLYGQVAEMIAHKNINRIIGIGEAISRQAKLFSMEKMFFPSTDAFLQHYVNSWFSNEVILIKGARLFGFERISRMLQNKGHETVLEINLNAVVHNYNYIKARLHPQTKIMCMVKAFGYGSGSFELANTLQFHRVNYLAVAYADEGVELRKAGITVPIMVMNPQEQTFENLISYHLEPEIYSFRILSKFVEALRQTHVLQPAAPFPIHLKLDTGMHRLGFEQQDLSELIVRIKNNKNIKVESVFTHLVGTDEPALDTYTQQQFKLFDTMSRQLMEHFNYPLLRHALNSSGIIRFPEMQLDMVRLGIALHGVASTPAEQRQLLNVATLKTTISQIRNVKKGDTVGYNRKGTASEDMLVATVGIGYADGISRAMGNGKVQFLVNGKLAPTIGNICMDMCMLDISNCQAREGDEVIVFGSNPTVAQQAKSIDTIPYEILSTISNRVKRIYFQE